MPARDRDRDDGVDHPAGGILSKPRKPLPRKPLRRTAWGLVAGGLAGLALIVGAGLIASATSQPAGPGDEATWPAGETMALYRVPLRAGSDNSLVAHCRLTPQDQQTASDFDVTVHERVTPDFSGDATITCDQEVTLQTGVALTVSEVTRGPLLVVPLFAVAIGILCFVPRFTYYWARINTTGWMRKMLRIPPPD